MEITDLPLVGGHPALDLVNTVERGRTAPGGQPLDYLTDPPALLRWAHRVNLVDEAEAGAVSDSWEQDPSSAHAALAAVRDTREALHLALLAAIDAVPSDTGTVAAALERLHSRWTAAVGRSRLVLEPERAAPAQLAVGLTQGCWSPTAPPTPPWPCCARPIWPACGAAPPTPEAAAGSSWTTAATAHAGGAGWPTAEQRPRPAASPSVAAPPGRLQRSSYLLNQ